MNKTISFVYVLLVVFMSLSTGWTVEADLQARVEELYQKNEKAVEAKDIDALMPQFSDDFVSLDKGIAKSDLKERINKNLFSEFEQIQLNNTIENIERNGGLIKVISQNVIQVKKESDTEWKTLADENEVDFLKEENGELKFYANAIIDKDRLDKIKNNSYIDDEIGYTLSAPENWFIIPGSHPRLHGVVICKEPAGMSTSLLGYIEIPYNIAPKEALEGDNAMLKRLAKDSYEIISSGKKMVGDIEGHESIVQFTLKGREFKRWSVYFNAGGLLYTFIFSTSPDRWPAVKSSFEQIFTSFSLSQEALEDGASRERAKSSKGEIVGQIYTNDQYGCQVAAPQGWEIESTNIGDMVSINMTPPRGDSLARFILVDTKGLVSLEKAFKSEMDGIKSLTNDFSSEEIEEIKVGEHNGLSCVYQFSLEGLGTLKRKSVMFLENDFLYMFVCDAIPPSEYKNMEPKFDQIIQSFTLN